MKHSFIISWIFIFFITVNLNVNAQDENKKDEKAGYQFTTVKDLPTTPVKKSIQIRHVLELFWYFLP
ncbi:MAG: hypothetical protein R2759_08340 [Bacteroidales bacterium]